MLELPKCINARIWVTVQYKIWLEKPKISHLHLLLIHGFLRFWSFTTYHNKDFVLASSKY